ncbi:hypothetical protein Nepgr_025992 [Nepenthes gracilis]|uniref:Uncharacterized protein n=1 Tax=Nepenthes gracilis TaxID=150966 RepID=A0AAD3Y1M1_NEPGR|nr:hypothetical protein Nepgr_025992 [Nepenthes gracilis]
MHPQDILTRCQLQDLIKKDSHHPEFQRNQQPLAGACSCSRKEIAAVEFDEGWGLLVLCCFYWVAVSCNGALYFAASLNGSATLLMMNLAAVWMTLNVSTLLLVLRLMLALGIFIAVGLVDRLPRIGSPGLVIGTFDNLLILVCAGVGGSCQLNLIYNIDAGVLCPLRPLDVLCCSVVGGCF